MDTSWFWIFFILTQINAVIEGNIQCLDKTGKPVDWFVVYKLPKIKESSHPLISEGLGHFYLDVNSPEWSLSEVSLNTTGHALWYTLQQIYKNAKSQDVFYAMYNDEAPDGRKSFTRGHTKGDVCFDHDTGFWLVHSLPKFPPAGDEGYSYPHNGLMYGQTFLCISMHTQDLDNIGKQFLYNYPFIYNFSMPASYKENNPNMADAITGTHIKTEPWFRITTFPSLEGQKFVSFAKFIDFNQDLYGSLVAPYLSSPLLVETWQNGPGKLPSNCSAKYEVLNIQDLNISSVAFKETHDHSKWAVTTSAQHFSSDVNWICIGDINRASTQFERAGGTVCFEQPKVWNAFQQSISQIEKCP